MAEGRGIQQALGQVPDSKVQKSKNPPALKGRCSLPEASCLVQTHVDLGTYTASHYFFHPLVENPKMNSNA